MKKLMLAAAIVCAAYFAQAAKISWSAYMIYDSEGTTILTKDPGLYLAKVTSSGDTIVSSIGDFSYENGENYTGSSYTLIGGTDVDGDQFVIVDAKGDRISYTDGSGDAIYTLSGFGTKSEWDPTAKVATFDVEDVQIAADIPEPTSGLLLLLGMAGLALKRKRT